MPTVIRRAYAPLCIVSVLLVPGQSDPLYCTQCRHGAKPDTTCVSFTFVKSNLTAVENIIHPALVSQTDSQSQSAGFHRRQPDVPHTKAWQELDWLYSIEVSVCVKENECGFNMLNELVCM